MNKSQAVAGNVTREEAAEFLREMGIESLRKRAGNVGGETSEKVPKTIQAFSKSKRMGLNQRWQKWIIWEYVQYRYGRDLAYDGNVGLAIEWEYERRRCNYQNFPHDYLVEVGENLPFKMRNPGMPAIFD